MAISESGDALTALGRDRRGITHLPSPPLRLQDGRCYVRLSGSMSGAPLTPRRCGSPSELAPSLQFYQPQPLSGTLILFNSRSMYISKAALVFVFLYHLGDDADHVARGHEITL